MAATAFTWPRFSATSTIATGAISPIACVLHTGAENCGRPVHGAAATLEKSMGLPNPKPLARSAYSR